MFTLESSDQSLRLEVEEAVVTVQPHALVSYRARFKSLEILEEFTQVTHLDGEATAEILSWNTNDDIIRLGVETVHIHNCDSKTHHFHLWLQRNGSEFHICHAHVATLETLVVAADGTISVTSIT